MQNWKKRLVLLGSYGGETDRKSPTAVLMHCLIRGSAVSRLGSDNCHFPSATIMILACPSSFFRQKLRLASSKIMGVSNLKQ